MFSKNFEKRLFILRANAGQKVSKCPDISESNSKCLYSSLLSISSLQRKCLQCSVSIPVRYVYNLDLELYLDQEFPMQPSFF